MTLAKRLAWGVLATLLSFGMIGALDGCPRMPAPDGCTPRDQRCHDGTPQVCSPSGRWTPADLACASIVAVCCATVSAYSDRPIHACTVPTMCLPADAGVR